MGRAGDILTPVFIGATVAALIAVTAPLTQTGINPAGDFDHRLIAYLYGWGQIAIPGPKGDFSWVYIAAPFMVGAGGAAGCFRFVIALLMAAKTISSSCNCEPCSKEADIT